MIGKWLRCRSVYRRFLTSDRRICIASRMFSNICVKNTTLWVEISKFRNFYFQNERVWVRKFFSNRLITIFSFQQEISSENQLRFERELMTSRKTLISKFWIAQNRFRKSCILAGKTENEYGAWNSNPNPLQKRNIQKKIWLIFKKKFIAENLKMGKGSRALFIHRSTLLIRNENVLPYHEIFSQNRKL